VAVHWNTFGNLTGIFARLTTYFSRETMNRDKKPSLLVVRHEFVTRSSRFVLLSGRHPAKSEPFISPVQTRIEPPFFGISLATRTVFRGAQKSARRSREHLLRPGYAIVIGRVKAFVSNAIGTPLLYW
jgi:hypothetical protein